MRADIDWFSPPEFGQEFDRLIKEKQMEDREPMSQTRMQEHTQEEVVHLPEEIAHMPEFEVPLTFGQKAVGLTFNPSGDEAVHKCKQIFADAIDQLNNRRGRFGPETDRLLSIAITEAQGAQMWAVKALTWKEGV